MRCALIGLGAMGRRHLAAIDRSPRLELVAACDRRPDAVAALAGRPGAAFFRDADEMFASVAGIELAIVASHAPSHAELASAALRAGARRVLCEKPVTNSLRAADRLADQAVAAGARILVNHSRRFAGGYRRLRDRLRSSDWGALRTVTLSSPGVGLACLGTHFVDLTRFLTGAEIECVAAQLEGPGPPNPRGAEFDDPGGSLLAVDSTGARLVLHVTAERPGGAFGVIETTEARIDIEEAEGLIRYRRRVGAALGAAEDDRLRLDLAELSAAALEELAGGGPLSCQINDGIRSLEAIVAARLSHSRRGEAVALPLRDADRALELPIT